MNRKYLVSGLTIVLSTGVIACSPSKSSEAPFGSSECAQTDTSIPCLLQLAETTLGETQDPFIWASGASELAVAYDVSGQSAQAEKLITDAIKMAESVTDRKQRGVALGEILTAIAALSKTDEARLWINSITPLISELEPRAAAEVAGKITVAEAIHEDVFAAFDKALNLPQETDVEGYTKAITIRKMANILAKSGDLDASRKAVNSLTMSIPYYRAMVRSDVARIAFQKGDKELAVTLLEEAEPVARSLGNGYFVGAALRDIAYSYHAIGLAETAQNYWTQALEATAAAEKQNEKARATSRLATRIADAGLSAQTLPILRKAAAFAEDIKSETMRGYSYYEIVGSAGISGQFEQARNWMAHVPDVPMSLTTSLRSSAERDLAWGLARFRKTDEALALVNKIKAPREKIHALSRIIRVLQNPNMAALPRYL